jgi:hypothetical protein
MYKLLFAVDDKGRTIWHMAADEDHLTQLQKIWEWAKVNLTRQEILYLWVVNQNEHE